MKQSRADIIEKIWDKRMIQLMDDFVDHRKEMTQKEFCNTIKFNPANLPQIVSGKQSFTHEQFMNACNHFGMAMDWFYGFTTDRKRKSGNQDPKDLLREALRLLNEKSLAVKAKPKK